jgi:hypothetical protein
MQEPVKTLHDPLGVEQEGQPKPTLTHPMEVSLLQQKRLLDLQLVLIPREHPYPQQYHCYLHYAVDLLSSPKTYYAQTYPRPLNRPWLEEMKDEY